MQIGITRGRGIGVALAGGLLSCAVGAGYLWGSHRAPSAPRVTGVERDSTRQELLAAEEPAEHDHDHAHPHDHQHPYDHVHPHEHAAPPGSPPSDAPELSPADARAREIRRIETSGPDTRNLLGAARLVGEDWAKMADEKDLEVSFDAFRCFHAGCLVNALHSTESVLDSATDEITRTAGFLEWNGEKLRTGPVKTEDGKTEVTWILFAPREGEQAMNDPIPTPERKQP